MNLRSVWRRPGLGSPISAAARWRIALGFGFLCCWVARASGQDSPLPQTGLVAYYPFAGSAADFSGTGNHGKVEGAVPALDRFGRPGAALHFDGQNDRILVANSPSLNIHGHTSLSICAWVRTETTTARQGIVNKWGPGGEEDDQFNLRLESDGTIHFELSDESAEIASIARLEAKRWYFIAGVYSATRKKMELYIDGVLDRSQDLDFAIRDTPQPLEIGKDEYYRWKGEIDEVRLYALPLVAGEVRALYQEGGWSGQALGDNAALPPSTGPVSWWPAEGNIGDQGSAPTQGKVVGKVGFVAGPVGQAFYFDGSSYIEAPADHLPTGDEARTLALWARVDESVAEESFFAGYGQFGAGGGAFLLGANGDGSSPSGIDIFISQWGSRVACSGCRGSLGQWYHVAVTSVGKVTTLYLNGVGVGRDNLTVDTAEKSSFYIGSFPGALGANRRLKGAIDEVRVYDRVLSEAEIRQLYSIGRIPSDSIAAGTAAKVLSLGGNGRVSIQDDSVFYAEQLTVEMWFELDHFAPENTTGWSQLLSNDEIELALRAGDRHLVACCYNAPSVLSNNTSIETGRWHHVALVNDGVHQQLLLDGELDSNVETVSIREPHRELWIGNDPSPPSRPFAGLIDEVRIWNRALSQQEIQARMRHPLRGDEPGLMGYWDFDGLDAQGRVPDRSGHGNAGLLLFDAHLVQADSPITAEAPPDSAKPDTAIVSPPPDSAKSDTTVSPPPPLDFSTFRILAIADVPNDRGRQVRIRWQRHPLDAAGARPQVTGYGVWRRFDPELPSFRPKQAATDFGTYPEGEWTFVGEVPARGVETYSYDAPTLADSTARSGIYYSTFFVSARTTAADSLYDCPPDSGYSVDNSMPAAPEIFTGALIDGQVRLVWSPVSTGAAYYVIYRGSTADFRPQVIHQRVFAPRFAEPFDPQQPFYCVAAYGVTGTLSPVTRIAQIRPAAHSVPHPEDFDGDGRIGFADFFSLVDAIGSADSRFDLDGDGVVDLGDYLLFAAGFGRN